MVRMPKAVSSKAIFDRVGVIVFFVGQAERVAAIRRNLPTKL